MTATHQIAAALEDVQALADMLGVTVFSIVIPSDDPADRSPACNTHNGDPSARVLLGVLFSVLRYAEHNGLNFEHWLQKAKQARKAVAS